MLRHTVLAFNLLTGRVIAETLEFPEGLGPGDELPGTSAEFFRYRSVFVRAPNDDDREESLRRSRFVLCDVCETVLVNLLRSTNLKDEDDILDALEGVGDDERSSLDPQIERIRRGKRGCQRHFKDSLMAFGYRLSECGNARHCLVRGNPRDPDDMDTYTRDNEGLFYACDQTVGSNLDRLARFFVKNSKAVKSLPELVKQGCVYVAKCNRHGKNEL